VDQRSAMLGQTSARPLSRRSSVVPPGGAPQQAPCGAASASSDMGLPATESAHRTMATDLSSSSATSSRDTGRNSFRGLAAQERQIEDVSGGMCRSGVVSPACVVVKDLLAAPCRGFMLAQVVCALVSAFVVTFFAIGAVRLQSGTVEFETICEEEATASMRAPYFIAMFLAGALLNCREFLSIPLL